MSKDKCNNTTAFVLGLIGGIFGILAGIFVLVFSGLVAVSGPVVSGQLTLGGMSFFVMSLVAIGSGILGIVGAVKSRECSWASGIMMLIAAILGVVAVSWGYIIAAPLLILAAFITMFKSSNK